MSKFKLSILVGGLILLASSCADESLSPILTFDKAGKGAYVRLIEESDKLINLFDIPGSEYSYSVEFVDVEQGDLVSEYRVEMTYVDVTGKNSTGPVPFRSFPASEFEELPTGFKGIQNISIPATEAIAAAGISPDEVNPGDQFIFDGYVVLQDGSVYGADNSSAAVRGDSFRGHFRYTLPAACPSSLEGSYEFQGSDFWCGGDPVSGSVEIIARGGGVYTMDDWSLGAYTACYGGFVPAGWGELAFTDVCNEVAFTGTSDNYGDTWEFVSSVDGNEWTITWVNTYGEGGSAVIVNPNGWPFTIVE